MFIALIKELGRNPLKDIRNSFITIEMIDISSNHPKYYNYKGYLINRAGGNPIFEI